MKIGKVCVKHPELNGERDSSSACRACRAERAKAWGVKYRADNAAVLAERRAAYYAANRDKQLEYTRQYNSTHAKDKAEYNAAYQRANAETIREKSRQFREANASLLSERSKARWAANREHLRAQLRQYRADNPDVARRYREHNKPAALADTNHRRASKLQATPAWANDFFIKEAYSLAKLREKVCGGKWHVDHIVPLRSPLVCGLHVEHNLQVIPARANLQKHNRHWPDMA